MNHQTSTVPQVIPQVAYQSPQALTQLMTESPFVDSGFVVPVFSPEDDSIACLNKAMAFLTTIASLRKDKGKTILVLHIRVKLLVQGEILQVDRQELLNATTTKEARQILDEEQLAFLADPRILASQAQTIIPYNATFQTEDLDTYDSECDDLLNAHVVLMANISNYGSDVISEIVQIVLWYLDSRYSKHMIGNRSQLMNFVSKFLGTVRFENDQIARIIGYGDYQLGNVIISRVYYIEGLGNNLFSIGQFCDADLEVAFRKNTCFIRNLEGVDLIFGSRDTNLYTISLDDMLKSSPICLLSKASKTKSWLWPR
nr:integrase, catalytic region, zinc finger, CCHC-type, peptidase aspartic, catalytic [Tanacetum cinerariifolium]